MLLNWVSGKPLAVGGASEHIPQAIPRNAPILITPSSHQVILPTTLATARFQFFITSDVAWGRTKFEVGGGSRPISFLLNGEELQKHPFKVTGEVDMLYFEFPEGWSTWPSDAKIISRGNTKQKDALKVEDRYGNIILYQKGIRQVIVSLKIPPGQEHYAISLDLTAFGAGELKDLVIVEATPPLGKTGTHRQYLLFANTEKQPPPFERAIALIEQAEKDFGFTPGDVVRSIRVVEEQEVNAGVRFANADTVYFNESILRFNRGYRTVGYHEAGHCLDIKLKISEHPKFQSLWQKLVEHPSFFLWLAEENFLPSEIGGHPYDGPSEVIASLLDTQFHEHLSQRLEQSDARFRELYLETLETVLKILEERALEGAIPKESPIFQKLRQLIVLTKNVVPAKLQENDFSAPYAAKLKVLQEAKGTFHYLPTGGIFARKNADSYTAGIAAGMRGESSFLQLKGLSEIHTIRGYAEIMAAQNWGKSGLTLLGSLGPMYEQETPLWEHQEGASLYRPSVISGHVGYAFQYMPFEQRIAHGGSVGIDVQMPYIDFPQDVRIGAKTLLFPTVDDYWIFLGAHLKF